MSRPLRIQYPGAWYHVMNRARRGQDLYPDRAHMAAFLDLLKETVDMFNLKVSSYCLMPTHYHLLVQTPDGNLSRCMRHLNGIYTQRLNVLNKCDDTLFRGRYKWILVDADSYLLELVRYIHRNPLRAGIIKDLNQYVWSSHCGYLSDDQDWEWLHKEFVLGMLAKNRTVQIKKYRQFVEKQDAEQLLSFLEKTNVPSLLGGNKFVEWAKSKFLEGNVQKDLPQSKILAPDGPIIINAVCGFYKAEEKDIIAVRRGIQNEPRDVAIYLLRTMCGKPLMQIGQEFGITQYSSVSSAVERIKKKRQNESRFKERLKKVIESVEKGQT